LRNFEIRCVGIRIQYWLVDEGKKFPTPNAGHGLTLRIGYVVVEPQITVCVYPAIRSDHASILQSPLLTVLTTNGLILEIPFGPLVRLYMVLCVRLRVPSSVDFGRYRSQNGELKMKTFTRLIIYR